MQPLRNILGEFTNRLGIGSGTALNAVRRKWADIVGQPVAAHTFPDTIRTKVLTIIVDTPQWMHHLSFFKEDISGKLKSHNIIDIRFRLGRLPEKPDCPHEKENLKLSDEDTRYLENTLKNIKDEELKEKFRTLIVHGLTKGRNK